MSLRPAARFGVSRRRFLAGGVAVTCVGLPGTGQTQIGPDGFRLLRAGGGEVSLPGLAGAASVDCFDGAVPGPVLRVKRGDELKVRLVNDLSEPVGIHWYGVRLLGDLSGQLAAAGGQSVDYRLRPPDAGTFWYRAIPARGQGLYGPLIVEELNPPHIDRDIALTLDNWHLLDDGTVNDAKGRPLLTANSAAPFEIAASTNERLRLRVINAGARLLSLRIERHDARVMAVDGQPAQPFLARNGHFALAPGNRVDLFVDATLAPGSAASIVADDDGRDVTLAHIAYGPTLARPEPLPEPQPLLANPLPAKIDLGGSLKAEVLIENGTRSFVPFPFPEKSLPAPLFSVRRGRAVTLSFVNRLPEPRILHLRGHAMRLLDRLDDGWKPFWLDTLAVEPGATVRTAFVADNPGKWAIESRSLGDRGPRDAAGFEVS